MNELRNEQGLTETEFLAAYQPGDYERPSNTVDMLLFTIDDKHMDDVRKDKEKELKVLLIKRRNHPDIHKWALPGGFVDIDENIDVAAYRELQEETNITNVYMEQLYTFGDVGRDKRMRVISIAHMALIPPDSVKPIAGDDAEDVAWFTVEKRKDSNLEEQLILTNEELNLKYVYKVENTIRKNGVVSVATPSIIASEENNKIAFDHIEIINMGIDRLRNKVEYVPIAFNLVPEKFTLNDIQKVYEVILGRKLVKQNFRKWIDRFVEELPEKQVSVGHRPATLYRYKEKHIDNI
ncbi:MAG: NUDIX domain-containing protein [Eubacteriales bacterium]|nr:NUDIX domain-containing protein [Eubacteriales bacterium]